MLYDINLTNPERMFAGRLLRELGAGDAETTALVAGLERLRQAVLDFNAAGDPYATMRANAPYTIAERAWKSAMNSVFGAQLGEVLIELERDNFSGLAWNLKVVLDADVENNRTRQHFDDGLPE